MSWMLISLSGFLSSLTLSAGKRIAFQSRQRPLTAIRDGLELHLYAWTPFMFSCTSQMHLRHLKLLNVIALDNSINKILHKHGLQAEHLTKRTFFCFKWQKIKSAGIMVYFAPNAMIFRQFSCPFEGIWSVHVSSSAV